eukprot:10933277-Ditylum_brightwellii.AAC.1
MALSYFSLLRNEDRYKTGHEPCGTFLRAISNGYCILHLPTALRAVLSTPIQGGAQYIKYPPFGGY